MNFIISFLHMEVYMHKKLYFNDYDIDDLKQMYKQFWGIFNLKNLMKIVFSELSKKMQDSLQTAKINVRK